jgi:hypothetical protein
MRRQFRWVLVMMSLMTMGAACSPAIAANDLYLFDVINKPAYARPLKALFDHAGNLPGWAREALKPKGDINGSPRTYVTIDGTSYEAFSECEPHNCNVNQLVLMFAPDGTQAWGVLSQDGKVSYLGAPSKAQQTALKETLDMRYDYHLSDVIKTPAYAQALKKLFDKADALPSWAQEIFKPSGYIVEKEVTRVNVGRTTYEVFTECMPHDGCEGTALVLIFAPNGVQAWAALFQEGTVSYFGAPSEAQQTALKDKELRGYYASDLSYVIKKPAYARALKNLFDHTDNLPSWAWEALKPKGYIVEYPIESVNFLNGDTTHYEVYSACEPYKCDYSELAVIFAPNGTQAWGVLVEKWPLSYQYLGAPSDKQAAALREALRDKPGH